MLEVVQRPSLHFTIDGPPGRQHVLVTSTVPNSKKNDRLIADFMRFIADHEHRLSMALGAPATREGWEIEKPKDGAA
jgi:hypothetical protein